MKRVGLFLLYCDVHPNMVGAVVVTQEETFGERLVPPSPELAEVHVLDHRVR